MIPPAGPFSRLFLDKTFTGDLNGVSKGQMMGAGTAVEGSAAYVAFEVVTGTLDGRHGTFILQHAGTMRKGAGTLHVTVVPDSGTGDLVGLTGTDDDHHRGQTAFVRISNIPWTRRHDRRDGFSCSWSPRHRLPARLGWTRLRRQIVWWIAALVLGGTYIAVLGPGIRR